MDPLLQGRLRKLKKYLKFITKQLSSYVTQIHIFDAKYMHFIKALFRYTKRGSFRTGLVTKIVNWFQP